MLNPFRGAGNTTQGRVVTDSKSSTPYAGVPGTGEGAAGIPPPAPDPTAPASGSEDGFAAYSTALSATVAIGCSLLLLNVLVFACVYHQRDKVSIAQNIISAFVLILKSIPNWLKASMK